MPDPPVCATGSGEPDGTLARMSIFIFWLVGSLPTCLGRIVRGPWIHGVCERIWAIVKAARNLPVRSEGECVIIDPYTTIPVSCMSAPLSVSSLQPHMSPVLILNEMFLRP